MQGGVGEVASRVRVGQDQHALGVTVGERRLQPGVRVEGRGGVHGLRLVREGRQVGGEIRQVLPGQGGRPGGLGVGERLVQVDAEPLELEVKGGELRVEETRRHQVRQFLVCHPQQLAQLLGGGKVARRQGGGLVGEAVERVPVLDVRGAARQVLADEDLVLGRGQAEGFHQDRIVKVGPGRRHRGGIRREQFQPRLRAEGRQDLVQGRLEITEEPPDGLDPEVEREQAGIRGLGQDVGIDAWQDVLGLRGQVLRGDVARVVGDPRVQGVVADVILEDLVDQVDVGHGRVGVRTGQGKRGQVRTASRHRVVEAPDEGIEAAPGIRVLRVHLRAAEELQQVHEIGGRAQDRSAVGAIAEVHVAEQPGHGRELLAHGVLGRLDGVRRAGEGVHRRLVVQLLGHGEEVEGDRAQLLGPAPHHRGLPRRELAAVLLHEVPLAVRGDLAGRLEPQVHRRHQRLVAGRGLEEPVQGLDVLPGRVVQGQGLGVLVQEGVQGGAPQFVPQRGRRPQVGRHHRALLLRVGRPGRVEGQGPLLREAGHGVGRETHPHLPGHVGRIGVQPRLGVRPRVRGRDEVVQGALRGAGDPLQERLPRFPVVIVLRRQAPQVVRRADFLAQFVGDGRVVDRQEKEFPVELQGLDGVGGGQSLRGLPEFRPTLGHPEEKVGEGRGVLRVRPLEGRL